MNPQLVNGRPGDTAHERRREPSARTLTRLLPVLGIVALLVVLALSGMSAMAQETQPEIRPDLGDAPDSSNHHGVTNTAYILPGGPVPGRFPTVYDPATGLPSGPLHKRSKLIWLGNEVSAEIEADQGPDADGINNILPDGKDEANLDGADDGWLNRDAPFEHCKATRLKVRVSKNPLAADVKEMFLNVWYDGTRDGDWQDWAVCPNEQAQAFEWIVQNFPVDLSGITGGFVDIIVPTRLVNDLFSADVKDAPVWLRFTLSEKRAPVAPQLDLADGRGPEESYELGETEDYLRKPPQEIPDRSDLGDAPDSTSNHHGIDNTAYISATPPIPGRYPTVWKDTPTTEPSGPRHEQANIVWLGDEVSFEQEADIGPDADGRNNILDGGKDNADNDGYDDGWLNPGVFFPDCRETSLRVRVSRAPGVQTGRMFLNVWFDGNRDGDWGDVKQCSDSQRVHAHEWIVRNFVVDTSVISGYQDIVVPTVLVMNDAPRKPAWVRFTLSEQPAPSIVDSAGNVANADGRGPSYPKQYRLGETEDYFYRPHLEGEPGQLEIVKHASVPSTAPVKLDDVFVYSVELTHHGGTAPALVVMTDVLPAEVKLVSGPFVTELIPQAAPLTAYFHGGVGPSGVVGWMGHMAPGSKIRIDFKVAVRHCPQQDPRVIHNVARAQIVGGPVVSANVDVTVDCRPPEKPEIELKKAILVERPTAAPELVTDDYALLPGQHALYLLQLNSNDNLTHTVHITDALPAGLVATDVGASSGVAQIIDGGHTVIWDGDISPHNRPIRIKIRVEPTERLHCEDRIVNVAQWATEFHHGESNKVVVYLVCRDLGDAPDSTNHFPGQAMTAYPGTPPVMAQFPTVFDPATDPTAVPAQGPMHLHPKPVHLGVGVTGEREADIGPDVDGVNNIEPRKDQADLDKRDDGLVRRELSLKHCEVTKVPVLINVDPAVISVLTQTDAVMYLNVWLDSNRDGDWADAFQCQPVEADNPTRAVEHIVIDFPVDVLGLGAGLHKVYAPTNGPVWWPGDLARRPAWLRVTLSERPSNKVLPIGCSGSACQYGDGRGYKDPFRFGETEDYLIRPITEQVPEPTEGADPKINKKGQLALRPDPATGSADWVAAWRVEYENAGYGTANDVKIEDTLDSQQTLLNYHVFPPVPSTVSGNTINFDVGTMTSGQVGFIAIRSIVSISTPPGTIVTNTATITASNDSDPGNNTAVVTLTVPLLPPMITFPIPGTICTGTITITGRAQPGVQVDLYIDGSLETTLTADANARWSYSTSLADGTHDIYAVARSGSLTSPPSPTVQVIVDSSLTWNPMSLRFEDEYGHVLIPRDSNGRLDESGWRVFLRRGTTYTVTVEICCTDPNAQVTLELEDGTVINLTDDDGDNVYSASFTTPSQGQGPLTGSIRICITCELVKVCSDGEVTIDPEGHVFNVTTGQTLEGAEVACMQAQTSSAETGGEMVFSLWPAADYGQVNPQTTASDGYFSFFTPAGTYQLQVSKDGYQPYRSWDIVVVDRPVQYNVPLTPQIAEAAGYTITIDAVGFNPSVLEVTPDSVVRWVNLDTVAHTSTSITPTVQCQTCPAALSPADGWDSGLLNNGEGYVRKLTSLGTYTYRDEENPTNTATIIVAEAEAPSSRVFLPFINR